MRNIYLYNAKFTGSVSDSVERLDTSYGLPSDEGIKWNLSGSKNPSSKGGHTMRFYNQQHKNYCGIDLHARKMYVCIIDQKGKMKVHQNIKTDPELLFEIIFPFLDDIVIGVECVFCWYWISDLCAEHKIPFVLEHALYMKSIHGGKTKNDKIDSYKIAALLRGGNFPISP